MSSDIKQRLQRIQVGMANEDEDAVLAAIARIQALEDIVKALTDALKPFANIKADDGDTFNTYDDRIIIRCEITVGDLKRARRALGSDQ